jgi:hypothetical protein
MNVMPFHMREDMKLPGVLLKNSRSQWCLQIIGIHMLVKVVTMVALGATQSRNHPQLTTKHSSMFTMVHRGIVTL